MPPDNHNFRRMADNGPQHYEGVVLDDDDDDIGLPIMNNGTEDEEDEEIGLELPPVEVAHQLMDRQAHRIDYNDATETGFEEFDNLVVSPQNQTDDDLTMRTQYGEVNFQSFIEELIFTLASKYTGYTDLNELRHDLGRDAGFSPDLVVQHFGFPNFTALMNSDRVQKYILVIPIEGKLCYMPRDFSRFSHIRDAQEITQNVTMLHMDQEERDKFFRSLLPANRDAAIRGRQRISEILYELGGETRPINWQEIQKKYKQKYDVELAGQELKRMFQRDKALSIIHTLFEKEVKTFEGNLAGHFFLQFKMPYHELVEYYEEQLRTHSEAEAYLKQGRHNANLPAVKHHKIGAYPIGPMQLQGNPAVDRFLEQGPSTSAAAGIPPPNPKPASNGSIQSATNPPNTIIQNQSNGPQPPSFSNSQTKTKFATFDLDAIPTKANPSLSERLAMMNEHPIQDATVTNSPSNRFRFNEDDMEAYSGPGNVPRNEANANYGNGMSENGNTTNHQQPASTKQLKYTNCVAPNDMTDSEAEEMDDEDDAASVAIAPGGTRPVARASQESTLPAFNLLSNNPIQSQNVVFGGMGQNNANNNENGTAGMGMMPPTSRHYHQRNILNYMTEKVNKKRATTPTAAAGGHTQTMMTPALPERTPTPPPPLRQSQPSHSQQQQKNVAFNSEDEEEEHCLPVLNRPFGNQPNNSNSVNAPFSSSVPQFRPPNQNQQFITPNPNAASTSSHQIHQIANTPRAIPANINNNGIGGGGDFQMSNSTLFRPPFSTARPDSAMQGESAANWELMNHVGAMSALANRMRLTFEIRGDEGSVIFRNGSAMVLVLTEFGDQIRVSWHSSGYIQRERYYAKVDWEMFSQFMYGIVCQTFVDENRRALPHKMFDDEAEANDSCGWQCEPNTKRCTRWGECSGLFNQNQQPSQPTASMDESSYQWDESDGWGQPPSAADADINSFPYGQPPSATTSNNINVDTIPGHMTMTMDNIGPQIPPQMQQQKWGCPPTQEAVANYDEDAPVMQRNVRHYLLEKVPSQFEFFEPPYPAYIKTVDGRDFLAFFTKIYGFSNHYSTEFKIDGVTYCCSEQYYMYMKATHFGFHAAAEEIMATTSSGKIKELGTADTLRMRQACGLEPGAGVFDHDEWRRVKPKVMMTALKAKFQQNTLLFNMLIQTGNAYLVEASPSDVFWGIGCALNSDRIREPSQWRGDNLLGVLLMRLRTELQSKFSDFDRKRKRPRSAMTHQLRPHTMMNRHN